MPQTTISFFILRHFPAPLGLHHQSADPSVQFSVTLPRNMTINTLSHYNNKSQSPIAYPRLSNAYWQVWNGNYGLSRRLLISLAHQRLGSAAEKVKRRWSLRLGLIHSPTDLPQLHGKFMQPHGRNYSLCPQSQRRRRDADSLETDQVPPLAFIWRACRWRVDWRRMFWPQLGGLSCSNCCVSLFLYCPLMKSKSCSMIRPRWQVHF